MINLHIGGQIIHPDWRILNIADAPGVDYVADCKNLDIFSSNSVNQIYASHVVEHLSHKDEFMAAIFEFYRVLVPGGKLMLAVPDMEILLKIFGHPESDISTKYGIVNIIFGGQKNPFDYHKIGLDYQLLQFFLQSAGFKLMQRVESFGLFDDASEYKYMMYPVSLNVISIK
jgi:predicted SAM-dependent methyltransferase